MYTIDFRQSFTVSLKIYTIFVILRFRHFNDQNKNSQGFPACINLHGSCISQLKKESTVQWSRARDMDTITEISVSHDQRLLLYSDN